MHQSIFDRYYRQPRALEFDASGWSFTYGKAVNARSWDDLTSYWDSGRTIVLADTFVHYPLATSAFAAQQREYLKELCEKALCPKEKLFSVVMFCTAYTYVRAVIAHRWRKRPLRMLGLYATGYLCALLLGTILAGALSVSAVPFIFASMIPAPIVDIVGSLRKFNSYYSLFAFHSADIFKDSICFRKPLQLWKVRLAWVCGHQETGREFRLYVSEDQLYLIPKKELTEAQILQFREILHSSHL